MAKPQRRVPRYRKEAEAKIKAEGGRLSDGSIAADLSRQAPNGSYSQKLFYRDEAYTCRDCGRAEVWTAERQQWWYEVAKGPIYSRAVRCRACREALRSAHGGTPRKPRGEPPEAVEPDHGQESDNKF